MKGDPQTLMIVTAIDEKCSILDMEFDWSSIVFPTLDADPTNLKATKCPKCSQVINIVIEVNLSQVKEEEEVQVLEIVEELPQIENRYTEKSNQQIKEVILPDTDLSLKVHHDRYKVLDAVIGGGFVAKNEATSLDSQVENYEDLIEEYHSDEDRTFETYQSQNFELFDKVESNETFLFECNICKKKLRTEYSLRMHRNIHTNKFKCEICHMRFIKGERLKAHVRKSHSNHDENAIEELEYSKGNTTTEMDFDLISDSKCHKSFRKQKEKGTLCARCGKSFASTTLFFAHTQTAHQEKSYECNHCGKILRSRKTFKHHIVRAHTEKSEATLIHQCNFCDARYMLRRDLNMHFKKKHMGLKEKKFQCEVCQKSYVFKRDLQEHFREHTGDQRPFKCDFCEKTFARTTAKRDHMVTHTQEKNFECKICKQKYSRKSYLKVHERIHTGVKPYKCSRVNCIAKFYDAGSFRQHRLMHERKEMIVERKECGMIKVEPDLS